MKRSTARWTTTLAAAALLGLPVGALAQTTPSSTQPPTSTSAPAEAQNPADDHLRQAEQALNDIPAASLTGRTKSKVSELKRHLTALQTAAAGATTGSASASDKNSWSTHLAGADKALNDLLGPASTDASEPTGTTGTTGTTGSSSAAAMDLDDQTRAKLTEVRTHLTAFAASVSGAAGAPSESTVDPSAASAADPTGSAASASSPATAETSSTAGAASSMGTTGSASSQPPATATGSENQTQSQSATAADPQASAAQVNPEEAKRHITAARESLSQLTQLPAASQLTGEMRSHVSQLISNFNELITTNTEWRASFDKVEANLDALIGSQTTDEPAAPATTGTEGAVGTSGTSTGLDPAIRQKLLEFREHLHSFEQAAGGAAAGNATDSAMSGTTSPESPEPTGSSDARAQEGHSEAMRHIAAIEAILNGNSSSAGTGSEPTAGTASSTSGSGSLDRAQIEQLRTHLNELKRLLAEGGR
jgi:hypothetical protein